MNNLYHEISDDTLCIVCFESVDIESNNNIKDFCKNCSITMHYDCLKEWCITCNDNKCPICLDPIKKIINIKNNNSNNNNNNVNSMSFIIKNSKIFAMFIILFIVFIYYLYIKN